MVEIDTTLAIDAARISIERKLPLADSIILATAQVYNATLWIQDADLKGLPSVEYIERKP